MKKLSSLFTLNVRDAIKGVWMAATGAAFETLYKFVNSGAFPNAASDWKQIGNHSLAVVLLYLMKNFLTNDNDKLLTPDGK